MLTARYMFRNFPCFTGRKTLSHKKYFLLAAGAKDFARYFCIPAIHVSKLNRWTKKLRQGINHKVMLIYA